MQNKILSNIESLIGNEKPHFLLAVSGGIDSMAMLDCFKKKSNQYKSRAKFINDLKGVDDIKTYLTSLNLLEDFIKNVSLKIDINGIFYFDIFNYYFFNKNSPKYEYRQLDNNVYYEINPKIIPR